MAPVDFFELNLLMVDNISWPSVGSKKIDVKICFPKNSLEVIIYLNFFAIFSPILQKCVFSSLQISTG